MRSCTFPVPPSPKALARRRKMRWRKRRSLRMLQMESFLTAQIRQLALAEGDGALSDSAADILRHRAVRGFERVLHELLEVVWVDTFRDFINPYANAVGTAEALD